MTDFVLNGKHVSSKAPPDTMLLWVIRDEFALTGTKFGCGIAQCGACTVHMDGTAIRSCITPMAVVADSKVVTIEGLAPAASPHPLQQAWVEEQVPQCGYCQSGQIMQAVALLRENPKATDLDIANGMNGNLCRCMAYVRIARAIKKVVHSGVKV